eukprot:1011295-Amphidinium_carterae.1
MFALKFVRDLNEQSTTGKLCHTCVSGFPPAEKKILHTNTVQDTTKRVNRSLGKGRHAKCATLRPCAMH